MIMRIMVLMLWFVSVLANDQDSSDWTWLYRKSFSENVRSLNTYKKALFFSQKNVSPFTQLIFSWNALRPEHGYFAFYAQVRDAETKRWGEWHHMVDWGKAVQRSYVSKSDGFSSYVHVRLEIDTKKSADGFRIKVEPCDNAPLSLVHSFFVALSNFNLFKAESSVTIDQQCAKTVSLVEIPSIAQFALDHEDKHRICSPVSWSMVVQYLTGRNIDPCHFAAGVFDSGLSIYGSWACNSAHAFEWCSGLVHCFVRRCNSFMDVYKQLEQGLPVVVSVRGVLPGALKPFPHGHLMVIIGWDSITRQVLCHDPASENHDTVFKRYPIDDFLRAWEASHRLSYIVESYVLHKK
jgi:peptidase C39-like protein